MAWTRKSSPPQCASTSAKTASIVAGIGDVAMADDMRAELGGERLDALLQRVALIGERELRALRARGAGDAPGDRAVVGDAHDEAALAGHQLPAHASAPRSPGRPRPWRPRVPPHPRLLSGGGQRAPTPGASLELRAPPSRARLQLGASSLPRTSGNSARSPAISSAAMSLRIASPFSAVARVGSPRTPVTE